MKRFIAVLLVLMLAGTSIALSDETAEAKVFADGLLSWAQGLDLERTDYHGQFTYQGIPAVDAVLRKDGGLVELSMQGLGRAQFSGLSLAMEFNGQKYYVDIDSIMGLIQPLIGGTESSSMDMEMIRPWLEKALQQVIMPCVSVSRGEKGLLLHIEASDEAIKERLYPLIDEIMAERTCVEGLMKRYGGLLSIMIANMPDGFDELLQAWESEKASPVFTWPDFRIAADVSVYVGVSGKREVTCTADISIQNTISARFGLEWVSGSTGVDMNASLDYYDVLNFQSLNYELNLHSSADGFQGTLALDRTEYRLDLKREQQDGVMIYKARLSSTYGSHSLWQYDLEARYDTKRRTLNTTLMQTDRFEETKKLASLEAVKRANSWDGTLVVGEETVVTGHVSLGGQYARIKLGFGSGKGFGYPSIDLWYYHPAPREYRVKLDTNILNRGYRMETYDLSLRQNEAVFDVTYGSNKVVHAALAYMPAGNGFDVNAEFMDYYLLGNEPSTFHLKKDGGAYSAELKWDYWSLMAGSAYVNLILGEDGGFRSFEANTVARDRQEPGLKHSYSVSYTPGVLLFADGNNLYELSVRENTARKLELQLTKDYRSELARLALSLEDDETLNGILTVQDQEMAGITIEPVDKRPLEAMDTEGAFIIDQALLIRLIRSYIR